MTNNLKNWKADSKKSPTRNADFDTISGKKIDLCYFPKNIKKDYLEKLMCNS